MSASTVQRKRREQLPSKRLKRKTLKAFGFPRTFGARWGGWSTIGVIAILALAFSFVSERWLVGDYLSPRVIKDTKALIIGLGALYLGFQQWRSSRSEVSLDTFWNRLSGTNVRLDEWHEVRPFAGPWKISGKSSRISYRHRMYVYLELDSLEYAIAKYRIGYMSSDDAYRSLNTFRQRCLASQEFCNLALDSVENYAYDEETSVVVGEIHEWRKDPKQWNKSNNLPEEGHPWEWRQEAQGLEE
jgi:hypothetical protein